MEILFQNLRVSAILNFSKTLSLDFSFSVKSVSKSDQVVIYNRVPKTGSTSFVGLAYDLCSKNKFNVLHMNISKNSHIMSLPDQVNLVYNV